MFDTFGSTLMNLRTELFLKPSLRLDLPLPSPRQAPALPLNRRVLDNLGSLLIEAGLRLKARALTRPEPASTPTWLITL